MSEQVTEPEAIELPPQGDAAFAALMDTLVADEADEAAGTAAGGDGAAASAAAAGGADAAGAGAGAAGSAAVGDAPVAGVPSDGADGEAPAGADGAADGSAEQPAAGAVSGDRPAGWTATAKDLIPKLGELSVAVEEKVSSAFQTQALASVREEHAQYFAALGQHPRTLVGKEVPRIDGVEGMETLHDTNDAREWQEATKQLLVAEVRDRAARQMEESGDFLATVHQSIELFQNNADLVPGTKDFDVELANRFATLAKPYELRIEEKLHGYSIPVQPIINQLREQLKSERAAKASPPAGTAAPAATPSPGSAGGGTTATSPAVEPPQAGIAGKAGSGSSSEDFSALFGTIGLPNLQI